MSVSPLQHISNFESYKSGEVKIDPQAAIAPGVVLKADPHSQIIIGKGVCIGMGAILHAQAGTLEVDTGANIGAGVLVVGKGKIGANACVGAATTILDGNIEPGQVVAPGSLIGDQSRQIAEIPVKQNINNGAAVEVAISVTPQPEPTADNHQLAQESSQNATPVVYGKASLNRLMLTLFPHKQSLSQPPQDGSSADQT